MGHGSRLGGSGLAREVSDAAFTAASEDRLQSLRFARLWRRRRSEATLVGHERRPGGRGRGGLLRPVRKRELLLARGKLAIRHGDTGRGTDRVGQLDVAWTGRLVVLVQRDRFGNGRRRWDLQL